jgi:hypothetical protein
MADSAAYFESAEGAAGGSFTADRAGKNNASFPACAATNRAPTLPDASDPRRPPQKIGVRALTSSRLRKSLNTAAVTRPFVNMKRS